MVESKVVINRKDYVIICKKLDSLKDDIKMYKESKDERCLDVMEKRISAIQNLLIEP